MSKAFLSLFLTLALLVLVGCETTTEPDLQPTEPSGTRYTIADEDGTRLGEILMPSTLSLPDVLAPKKIDGEAVIVVSDELLALSVETASKNRYENGIAPQSRPPTVLGNYTQGDIQDLVTAVLTPNGPRGIINHKAGFLGLFPPFKARPDCMVSLDFGGKAIILASPVGSAPDEWQYTPFYYENSRLVVFGTKGFVPDPCSNAIIQSFAQIVYPGVPIDDGRLTVVF